MKNSLQLHLKKNLKDHNTLTCLLKVIHFWCSHSALWDLCTLIRFQVRISQILGDLTRNLEFGWAIWWSAKVFDDVTVVHAKEKARNQLCLLIITTIFELFRTLLLFLVLLEEKGKWPRWTFFCSTYIRLLHFFLFYIYKTRIYGVILDVKIYKDQAEVFNVKMVDQLLSILWCKKLVNLYRIEMVPDAPEQYKISKQL